MAHEPAAPAASTTTTPTWQLVCQLMEEVGFLRGVLQGLLYEPDNLDQIVALALKHHDELSAVRRMFSVAVPRNEAGVLS